VPAEFFVVDSSLRIGDKEISNAYMAIIDEGCKKVLSFIFCIVCKTAIMKMELYEINA
jgi:hypothetical protein